MGDGTSLRRTATTLGLSRRLWIPGGTTIVLCDCAGGGIFEPAGRTATATPTTSCEAFECQNSFFDLLPFKPELGKHFVDVQDF